MKFSPTILLFSPTILLATALILVIELSSPKLLAKSEDLPKLNKIISSLEINVWTKNEHQLPELSNKVVRQIQVNPNSPYGFYLLSHLKLREFTNAPEDFALVRQASELAQQAIDLAPSNEIGYVALAEALDVAGQSEKASKLLSTSVASGVEPGWRYYFTQARLQAQSAPKEKVLALLSQSIAFTNSEPDIIIPYVVAVLQTTSQTEDLLHQIFEWDSRYPHDLFKLTIAKTMGEKKQHLKAHTIFKAIYNNKPSSIEALVNDGIILYEHLNKPKEAKKLFEKALALTGDKNAHLEAQINYHIGVTHLALHAPNKAKNKFIAAIRDSSDKLNLINYASQAYRRYNEASELHALFQDLTQENRPSGMIYALLGETQSEDLQKHEDALHSFANAIILEPNRSDYYNGMGLAYYRMNKNEKALSLFREATKIDPNDATAMYNGACVLSKLGQIKDSLSALHEALTLDPRLADHAKTDADFVNIKAKPEFSQIINEAFKFIPESSEPSESISH